MPTNEIARSTRLYALVADEDPDRLDYRALLPDAFIHWGFVSNDDIFSAALHLESWDVVLVDQSMIGAIPSELLVNAEVQEEAISITLLVDGDQLDDLQSRGLLDLCGYLLRGPTLEKCLGRMLRRNLYVQALNQEREHLEREIERILSGWEASLRDRTKRLERANQELKAIDELKSRFLANISHELRTPLSVIRSYVELLLDCPPESAAEQQEFLGIVSTETHRLSRMINDLLDLARIESGRMDWNITAIDLHHTIEHALTPFQHMLAQEGLTIEFHTIDEIPPVLADADRLTQVFTNLVDNSIKHTPRGGTIIIDVDLFNESSEENDGADLQDLVKISVSDTGVGIEATKLESIFNRFEQGSQTDVPEDQRQGAGLGLAICREIISYHKGNIWAENCDEQGARIIFTLPLAGHLESISGNFSPIDE